MLSDFASLSADTGVRADIPQSTVGVRRHHPLGSDGMHGEKLTCSMNEANGIDIRNYRVDHHLPRREHRLRDGHIATHRECR